jgi:uncharacterized protein YggU (UPF0235/DUF167 family)
VRIVAGAGARLKVVHVAGVSPGEVERLTEAGAV